MNNRKIIYITKKELEKLDINIPIYILIDPEIPKSIINISSSTLNIDYPLNLFENSELNNEENNENNKEKEESLENNNNNNIIISETNSLNLISENDFLYNEEIINFNDDFITSIEITTEELIEENNDQIKTPEYAGLYTDEFYDSIYNSDANSDIKSSDYKDSTYKFNSLHSSSSSFFTAVVSQTLDSYKQTQSSFLNNNILSFNNNDNNEINLQNEDSINNLLYDDINDEEYSYKFKNEDINKNNQILFSENNLNIVSEINDSFSPISFNISSIVNSSVSCTSINSLSVSLSNSSNSNSKCNITSLLSSSICFTNNSQDIIYSKPSLLPNNIFNIISPLTITSILNIESTPVNFTENNNLIMPQLPSFNNPPPVICCPSSSIEPFKVPFSVPYTINNSIFCPISYSNMMPPLDLSKPPPMLNFQEPVVDARNPEIEKIKKRRNAERTEKQPLAFKQYSYLEMDINGRYLKRQKDNKNVVIGTHKMKGIENRFVENVISRRSKAMINQPVWCAIDRSEFDNKNVANEEEILSSAREDKDMESISDSDGSDLIKSDSDDDLNEPMSGSNFTKIQMNQLAQIEKKVEATRRRLNLNKNIPANEFKSGPCVYNCRKRSKSRMGYQSNPPKKAKQSSGYLTIQENNLHNNAPVISGGRTIEQQAEISHKLKHPYKLNSDIWYNEQNELNDGPACSCLEKYRIGPLHNDYYGESPIPICDPNSNNYTKLYHYRLIISPPINFISTSPTIIKHNDKNFSFGGYSIFTHKPVIDLPFCQIVRFNIVYNLSLVEDIFPPGFTVRTLDLMTDYIFTELLELLDLKWWPNNTDSSDSCRAIHLFPRFERSLSNKHVELLSADIILKWMLDNAKQPLFDVMDLPRIHSMSQSEWSELIDPLRGCLATYPGKKPAAIRVDQVDRISLQSKPSDDVLIFPVLVHMSMAPMKLGLTREPAYKRLLRNFLKLQYLILNRPEVSKEDRAELNNLARLLENFEMNGIQRREFTVEISSDGFFKTGISTDIVQFALCIPSMMAHIRFHLSLAELENRIKYSFKDKSIIHQALTHPSFRNTNYGTNPDHYQNTMTSCGLRHIEYGDKIGLYRSFRKKGLSKMVHVMSHMPYRHETRSTIYGNERLECHGDAVIELITSVHLFYMFPELSEGHLDSFRQALVQNHYLADLSVKLGFHKYLLYTHNMDFSYDSTITHARSDAFEAVMAAVALDGGLDEADRIFGCALFGDDARIHKVWCELPCHPLQEQFPKGDRHVIQNSPIFQHLTKLEDRLGIHFKHIRLLAKAMTIRKTGYNFFTLGDNQRLEFLGDSLLKYVTTDYLFKHFPRHHEGHISLLRNTLVNRYTQATVCTELGLDEFIIRKDTSKTSQFDKTNQKPRADLLEAFLGALFVDKDLTWVERFSQVCFWPRLVDFILNQSWNDPKSRLQQCCLTYRSLNEDPEIAHYKLITTFGSTDHREFKVAVYFRGMRLATGFGKSIQAAQMNAATLALEKYKNEFKQLDYQEKVINDQYDQSTRNKILNQFENWDSELVEKFVEKSHCTYKTMGDKFVPNLKKNDGIKFESCNKIKKISRSSTLGELLKNVKKN